jgi:hypothetical protein
MYPQRELEIAKKTPDGKNLGDNVVFLKANWAKFG